MNTEQPTPETDRSPTVSDAVREYVYADFARKLERERDEARKERDKHLVTLQYVTGQLIEAGLDDGASPVEKMARRAVEMSNECDQLLAENEKLWRKRTTNDNH